MRAIFLLLSLLSVIGVLGVVVAAFLDNVLAAECCGVIALTFGACALMEATSNHTDFTLFGDRRE